MLLWSDRGRMAARAVTAVIVGMLYVAPAGGDRDGCPVGEPGRPARLPAAPVTLPLLMPYLLAAFSLSFALTDRGDVFQGAALTVVLILVTLAVPDAMSLVPKRAAGR